MKKIDSFINCYSLSKTLRFSLIPVGRTEETFDGKCMLEKDRQRAKSYEKVKEYINRFNKSYIESVLSDFKFSNLDNYVNLYFKAKDTASDKDALAEEEAVLRKQVAKALSSSDTFNLMFDANMIKKLLPQFLSDEDELKTVGEFKNFCTYFTGFFSNRKNMYSDEAHNTSIANRCINDNLPKFLDNVKTFSLVEKLLSPSDLISLATAFNIEVEAIKAMFVPGYFNCVLTQSGIDFYNSVLGGFTSKVGEKLQGLNEYINLHNQKYAKDDKSKRIPRLKPLFKQILSERESRSYIPTAFSSDDELLCAVNTLYKVAPVDDVSVEAAVAEIGKLFSSLNADGLSGIYISGAAVNNLSSALYSSWSAILNAWNSEYAQAHPIKKNASIDKYEEKRNKEYKRIKSFDLDYISQLMSPEYEKSALVEHFKKSVSSAVSAIDEKYSAAKTLLTKKYAAEKKLSCNDDAIALIKDFLDSLKQLETLIKPLCGSGKEENKNGFFYGVFSPAYATLSNVDELYNTVRDYVTQKPYSNDKIKLNFDNPQLLGGWERNKEKNYRTVLLRKEGLYYLAIMSKDANTAFETYPLVEGEDRYEKMVYKLLPNPHMMLPKVFFCDDNMVMFQPSEHILKIRREKTFKKSDKFNLQDCHDLIDFYKSSIERHEDWRNFGFKFSPTEFYRDISEFYNEVACQGYSVRFDKISSAYVDSLVAEGKIYLFQIYNKDFSAHSKGKPNLHTMYFKMLFDERNLRDVVYKLSGGGEMFYRKASISDKEAIVHPANMPIDNKNPANPDKTSTFPYPITKDKRYTKRQFSLHLPIVLNFKAENMLSANMQVRTAIKKSESNYVIGIDRGERNLIYICVINSDGEIEKQISLNEITRDKVAPVDYHALIAKRNTDRQEARQSWQTIANIKELKSGYLSQVIHEICTLAVKYDAVIAMEDLNAGFKHERSSIDNQVYQKFEQALSGKLSYLIDKELDAGENGGWLRAYQLVNKDFTHKGMQNGFILYVPAWLTSKIDPTTGFADLIRPQYTTVAAAKDLFSRFERIAYKGSDMFEFSFHYSDFPKGSQSFRNDWTICSNGERIYTFKNPDNNQFDKKTINLSSAFKELFAQYNIALSSDMKDAILNENEADFFKRLTGLLKLTLQMRNSNNDTDYIISPVRNASEDFYDSRKVDKSLPKDSDANGAYNIARKALWAIEVLKNTPEDDLAHAKLSISKKEWLEYAQKSK